MDIGKKMQNMISAVKGSVLEFFKTDSYNGTLIIAALLLVNIAALDYNFRIDLTRDGVYSLSPVSKRSVKNLTEPMKVKIFFSEDLPAPYSNTRLYLQDIMQEYNAGADSLFSYEFMNMADPEIKKQAEAYGIYPVQINQREGDEYKAVRAYMGVAIIHGDLIETINELTDTQGLEYRITTAVSKMKGKLNLLASLEDNIQLTLYVSSNLKDYSIFPPDIESQLDAAVSDYVDTVKEENSGKLNYEFKQLSSSEIESMAGEYGFAAFSWPEMQTQQGNVIPAGKGLIGVLVQSGDKFSALSVGLERSLFGFQLSGLDGLGNRINDAIDSMLSNNPAIGYVTSGDTRTFNQQDQQSAVAFQQLVSSMYEIKSIDLASGPVPESIKTLVVNGPKKAFTETELFRIDNFIMRGGNVLFLVDSFFEILPQQQQMFQMQQPYYMPLKSGVTDLLSTYGITVNADYVMDMNSFVARQQGMETPLYFAPMIDRDQMSAESVATKYLKQMLLLKVSSIDVDEAAIESHALQSRTLLSSSEEAWTMTGQITLMPQQIQIPSKDDMKTLKLALMVEGKFPSHFASGMPDEMAAAGDELSVERAVEKGVASSKIAVIGTSELTTQQLIDPSGRPRQGDFIYNNTLFIQNLIDELNGNESIPQMRSKGLQDRLEEVDEKTKLFNKGLNIFALPILSIIFGLVAYRLRIQRKKRIQTMFAEVD